MLKAAYNNRNVFKWRSIWFHTVCSFIFSHHILKYNTLQLSKQRVSHLWPATKKDLSIASPKSMYTKLHCVRLVHFWYLYIYGHSVHGHKSTYSTQFYLLNLILSISYPLTVSNDFRRLWVDFVLESSIEELEEYAATKSWKTIW